MSRIILNLILLLLLSLHGPGLSASIVDTAGFHTLPRVTYSFNDGTALSNLTFTSSQARLFYSFIRADGNAGNKPLFLFFNGGPGSGTTCGLMGFYTGRRTLDNRVTGGGDHYIENPWSWTQLGNLLYIDARCAGFSYGILPPGTPRDNSGLFAEFSGRNFNSYIDAADYIRVLLAFLADQPALRDNPIVIVGESYGGVRATLMLHMLLHYRQYGNGEDIYQDPELVAIIQAHLDAVFPDYTGQEVPAEVIARQFRHQVLIQPAIDEYRGLFDGPMLEQPGSLVYQVARETGTHFNPCQDQSCDPMSHIYDFIENVAQRDIYGCHKPKGWTDSFFDHAGELLLDSVQFKSIMGIDPLQIAELRPQARSQAYKYWQYTPGTASGLLPAHQSIYPDLPSDRKALVRSRHVYSAINSLQDPLFFIPIAFGPLQPFDAYFSGLTRDGFIAYHYLNPSAARGYASYSYHPLTGWKFLQNLLHVNTFITNAKYDLVVYTNALPPALAMHTDLVSAVIHQSDRPNASTRPGLIEVRYRSEVLGAGENPVRTIRFPYYTDSSHPVSLTEPAEFFHDVQTWLKER